jgi:hypothetical protein
MARAWFTPVVKLQARYAGNKLTSQEPWVSAVVKRWGKFPQRDPSLTQHHAVGVMRAATLLGMQAIIRGVKIAILLWVRFSVEDEQDL